MHRKIGNIFLLPVLLIMLSTITINSFAGKRYWVGTGANKNWNSTGNWSTTSGGGSGASVPSTTDTAYFNGSGLGQCLINAATSIKRWEISSGYTDTIKQTTLAFTIGTGGTSIAGGTFWGGSAAITNTGSFTMTGGIFRSTSGRFNNQGNFTTTGGTYIHNNGEMFFTGVFSINTSFTFYDCRFYVLSGVGGVFAIDTAATMTVSHLLTVSAAALNTGRINVTGDLKQDGANFNISGHTATLVINGSTDQILYGQASSFTTGFYCNIDINKSAGNLFLKDNIVICGKLKYIAGSVDITTYANSVCFSYGSVNGVEGKMHLSDLVLSTYSTTTVTVTIPSGDTVFVEGELHTRNGGIILMNGIYNSTGNLKVENTSVASTSGGTGTILVTGSNNQTYVGNTTSSYGRLPNIVIKKSGGTLTLKEYLTIGGNFTFESGLVDASTYNSTVVFGYSSSKTITTDTLKLNNVTFFGNTGVSTNVIPSTDTLEVLGNLTFQGTNSTPINTGVVAVKGDIIIASTYSGSGTSGTGTILINGNSAQKIAGANPGQGKLCTVKVMKSGTLTLENAVSIGGDWLNVSGTVDATTDSSNFVLANGTKKIVGNMNLYDLTVYGAVAASDNTIRYGDSLVVQNDLTFSGAYNTSLDSGLVIVKGDIFSNNTSVLTSTGGNATIVINGTGDQLFDGNASATQNALCHIKIRKSTGTLKLKDHIGVRGSWTYISGNVDVSSYSSTVSFANTTIARKIIGTVTLDNVTFYAQSYGSTNTIRGTDSISVLGTLKIEGNQLAKIDSGTVKAYGNIIVTNTNTGVQGNGLVRICGSNNQSFTGSGVAGAGRLPSIQVEKTGGVLTLSSIITISGNWKYISGIVDPGSSTVVNEASGNVSCGTLWASAMFFNHFRVKTGTTTLTGVLRLNGNLLIDASRTLNATGQMVSVEGNWTNNGTFTYASSMVYFEGAGSQYLMKTSGTETFHILNLNKSSGKVYLTKPVTVNNTLYLNGGVLVTTSTNIVNIPDNGKADPGTNSSYVAGPFKKTGDDIFTFPLGDTTLSSGAHHPLTMSAPTGNTSAFTAQYYASDVLSAYPADTAIQWDTLQSISNCEYWALNRVVGTSAVKTQLNWNTNSCNVSSPDDLMVTDWDGTRWKPRGRTPTGVPVAGAIGSVTAARPAPTTPSLILIVIGKLKNFTVNAGPDFAHCTGGSTLIPTVVTGLHGTLSYAWLPTAGLSSSTILQPTASPTATTTYTVTATETSLFYRTRTDAITVTVSVPPAILVSPANSTIAGGGSSVLTASGAVTYAWSPSTGLSATTGASVTASPTVTTVYTVTGTSTLGCTSTGSSAVLVDPDMYPVLKKTLDGGYYNLISNVLYFKYDEEYVNGNLNYKVYDLRHEEMSTACSLGTEIKKYGDNRYGLDFTPCAGSLISGQYYTLEVKSDKNETYLLKFKY